MSDVAIISASYGNYDTLKPALKQEGLDVDWVMVTDSLELKMESEAIKGGYSDQQWRIVFDPRNDIIPFRAAKRPKMRPWEYTDAPASIWVDGSVQVHRKTFAAEALNLATPLACFPHGERNCLYTEARVSRHLAKYKEEPLAEQTAHYKNLGHPENWGLWVTTVIVRQHTDQVKEMSLNWEREMEYWSSQDQVSFPFALRNAGLRPTCMHGSPGECWGLTQRFAQKHLDANKAD